MLYSILTELSLIIGLIMLIVYGLFSLNSYISFFQMNTQQMNTQQMNTQQMNKSVSINYSTNHGAASYVNLSLNDCYFFCSVLPLMFLLGYCIDFTFDLYSSNVPQTANEVTMVYSMKTQSNNIIDILLVIITIIIMESFKTFESKLLLILAFIGQYFMLHSCDLVTFYICLEIQNFSFMVLCGLQPRSFSYVMSALYTGTSERGGQKILLNERPIAGVEASIKYLLLSAFASGFLLFWFSILYLKTGMTSFSTFDLCITNGFSLHENVSSHPEAVIVSSLPEFFILLALMFKLGAAPLHVWMIDIYVGIKRELVLYISSAPKLSLFGFWVSTFHSVWTEFTVLIFVGFSMIIGCFGAYNQPVLRSLFAFSTVNEIGLMLMAIETAGFSSLFQHLTIYIATMLVLWSNSDKRLLAFIAISLAGLPPLAGFFGKAWIFSSVGTGALSGPYLGILVVSLFCTGLSLVYYLRIFRLFGMNCYTSIAGAGERGTTIKFIGNDSNITNSFKNSISTRSYFSNINGVLNSKDKLTSFCVVYLVFAPIFYLKPFVI
jgi:NADH:ubiquinone oxidoreductase subunit 2 (subunit N)